MQHVQRIVDAQEALRGDAAEVLGVARQKSRDRAGRGELPSCTVGDSVLVATIWQYVMADNTSCSVYGQARDASSTMTGITSLLSRTRWPGKQEMRAWRV